MITAASTMPKSNVYSTGADLAGAGIGYSLRAALRAVLRESLFSGVSSFRLLPSEQRYERAHDKVYFVLETHDIERDRRIVEIMVQFESVDYDLVPAASIDFIPALAIAV